MSGYKSLLKKRTELLTPADFDSVPGLYGVTFENKVDMRLQNAWEKTIPITPADFISVFRKNFGRDIELSIDFKENHLDLRMRPSDSRQFAGSAEFNLIQAGQVETSSFRVELAYQGEGHGKAWLKSRIELLVAMGFSDFRFLAADTNGAYTWAKAGVHLDMSPLHAAERDFTSRSLLAKLELLKPSLAKNVYGFARALCRMVAKDDLVRLAQIPTVLPSSVQDDLQLDESPILQSLKDFYTQYPEHHVPPIVSARQEQMRMRTAFSNAARMERPATLGRILLTGQSWYAHVDFEDDDQMKNLGTYLGGWNHIEPAPDKKTPAFEAGGFQLR